MRFARIVFIIAGIWGLAVLPPFYWLVDITGRHYTMPMEYPHFFYGFFDVTMAWQLAFLVIGSDPVRYRPLMLPAMVEKFSYVVTLAILYTHGRIGMQDAQAAVPDLILGTLFIAAFAKTRTRPAAVPARTR